MLPVLFKWKVVIKDSSKGVQKPAAIERLLYVYDVAQFYSACEYRMLHCCKPKTSTIFRDCVTLLDMIMKYNHGQPSSLRGRGGGFTGSEN